MCEWDCFIRGLALAQVVRAPQEDKGEPSAKRDVRVLSCDIISQEKSHYRKG